MKTILNFIRKNILENKFRTIIIILSVMVSSSLFFASTAISTTMSEMIKARMQQYSGSSDLIIRPEAKSPSKFFSTAGLATYKNKLQYSFGAIEDTAQYVRKDGLVDINVLGTSLEDLKVFNPVVLEQNSGQVFSGEKIIISKYLSQRYGLAVGDLFELNINGVTKKPVISAIAYPSGIFKDESTKLFAILPIDLMNNIYNANGCFNITFIKLQNINMKKELIADLSNEYKNYTVREAVSPEDVKQQTGSVSISFLLMTIIVAIMCIFIIYSSFKVITFQRLSIMGVFRSVGATSRMTNLILIAESTIYGLIGGFLGSGLGIGILYIMSILIKPQWMKTSDITIQFTWVQVVLAFTFAVVLCFISSLAPILKSSKIPLKDLVLNKVDRFNAGGKSVIKLIIGVLLITISLVIPRIISREVALPADIICAVSALIAMIMLVPYITRFLIKIFNKVILRIFGNIGVIALKNLREEKNILNNIALLCVSISSLLMINLVTSSALVEMTEYYSRIPTFDLMVYVKNMDKNFEKLVYSMNDVQYARGFYTADNIEVKDKNTKISLVEGSNKDDILNYWKMDMYGDSKKYMGELNSGRNIVLNIMLKNKLRVDVGDKITLLMDKGEREYTIIGFANTARESGSYAIIPEEYIKLDMDMNYFQRMYIKTSMEPYKFESLFRERFATFQPKSITMKETARVDFESSKQQFYLLIGFSVIALLIGILSIFNNLVVSFLQRKRYMAMLRSLGMCKTQIVKMVFIEGLIGGIVGSFTGIIGGLVLVSIVPYLLTALYMRSIIHYSIYIIIICFAVGVLVNVIASIGPALKTSKLNIIESIKME